MLILSPQSPRQEFPVPQVSHVSETAFLNLPKAADYLGISPNTLYV